MDMQRNMDTENDRQLRVVLTGGHAASPGIAVSEELKRRYPNAKLFWIGSKYAVPGSRVTTLEYKIFPEIGVKFYSLITGKIQTKFTRYTIPLFLCIPFSFVQALLLVIKLKPRILVSFGGFSSFPVIFWGWVLRIPVILHEQTVAAGRANIISAFFARKIALSRGESLNFFPRSKSVVTGNPILAEMLAISPKMKLTATKTILVVGGSRGSEFINEEIFKIVPELIKKYRIIHITGERDFRKYKEGGSERYKVLAFVDPREMPRYYGESDLIIARSGASTVSEILYIKRPAIFIPLPRTFMDEQYKNAKYAESFGLARVLRETEVSSASLIRNVDEMFHDWQKIVDKVLEKKSPDSGASQKIVDMVGEYI
jgi:UDP-N-acetylglucosamine--N-acetylmuramyl-(pentapeptide) pyrophosphoryl-undecaprenol N-acetylglucosamine transferase